MVVYLPITTYMAILILFLIILHVAYIFTGSINSKLKKSNKCYGT